MKRIFQRMTSWWFVVMVPECTPLTTIEAREQRRKRRILSIILVIDITMLSPWFFVGSSTLQQRLAIFVSCSIWLVALFLNKWGYLKIASLICLLSSFLSMAAGMINQSFVFPILSFVLWPVLLILPVIASLLLPSWGVVLITGIEMLFMLFFVDFARSAQISMFAQNGVDRTLFLLYALGVFIGMGGFSTISVIITRRAVIQADRATELEQAHRALSEAYETIQKQALTDGLTGLPNHRALVEQLEKEMERARRYTRPLSILFFDADRFKLVNDTHGHAAGDIVLCQIGERAGSILRREDTIGRFGGEEFVVLLPETDVAEAGIIAERIRAAVAAHPVILPEFPNGIATTVSIGLATYPLDGNDGEILLTVADEAMYISKRMGRNQVRTAEEARQMSADVELMALLQEEKKRDDTQRDGPTPERLREAYTIKIISSLTGLLDRRDKNISAHAYAVSDIATALAQKLDLDAKQVSRIGMAALLHDIGKIAIPDVLLQKTGTLSVYEVGLLREHAELGAQILEANPFLGDLVPAVRYHHEYWDGGGYPEQLAGEAIPLAARILAIAEAYDAMQRDYPYQHVRSPEDALLEIQKRASKQFDPLIVQAFTRLLAELQAQEPVLQRAR